MSLSNTEHWEFDQPGSALIIGRVVFLYGSIQCVLSSSVLYRHANDDVEARNGNTKVPYGCELDRAGAAAMYNALLASFFPPQKIQALKRLDRSRTM